MHLEFAKKIYSKRDPYPEIPLILISQGGEVSEYARFNLSPHLLNEEDLWAGDALSAIQHQCSDIRRYCPELIHNFAAQGSAIAITEGDPSIYKKHVLKMPNVKDTVAGATLGMAQNVRFEGGSVRLANVFWHDGFFLTDAGKSTIRKSAWAIVVHEMTHTADRKETEFTIDGELAKSVDFGRHTETDLFRAIVNLEEGTNPDSVCSDIRSEAFRYPEDSRIHEYLPRLMERYVNPKMRWGRELSDLERAYIEKVFLPDVTFRAEQDIAKQAHLLSQLERSLGCSGISAEERDVLLTPLPSNVVRGQNSFLYPHKEKIRDHLMTVVDSVLPNAERSYLRIMGNSRRRHDYEEPAELKQS